MGVKTGRLAAFGVLVLALYLAYNWWPFGRSYHQHHGDTWKTPHISTAIPESVQKKAADVHVHEKSVNFKVMGKNGKDEFQVELFYLEAPPVGGPSDAAPVVFLHGQGDSSENWLDIGSVHLVAAAGHRVIAVDLLGHGRSSSMPNYLNLHERRDVLAEFLKHADVDRPILVPASMGGSYALPYMMDPDPEMCHQRVRGFVPIAIVSTDGYTAAQYHKCEVPSMIVFGVNDTNLGLNSVGNLRNLQNNEIVTIQKAGHACHHEQPSVWHEHLYNFLIATRKH